MKKYIFLISTLALTGISHIISSENIRDDSFSVTREDCTNEAIANAAQIESQIETQVFNLINQNRIANGLPALTLANVITTQARNHSLDMANKIVPFGHQGVEMRFTNLKNSIPNLTRFGENVAYNKGYSNPAEKAVSSWLASSGHRANIMGDFNLTGVGVAKNAQGEYYFTQIFVKASSSNLNFDLLHEEETEQYIIPLEFISEEPCLFEIDGEQ